jgi:hypothetical protein
VKRFLTILIILFTTGFGLAQTKVEGFISGSAQWARNKKNFASDASQWKSSFYNAVKGGAMFNKSFIVGVEYSAILYRWTDRFDLIDLLIEEGDEDDSPPTVGEKINNYKLFTQIFPFKQNGFFMGAGWGYSHYRNFRTPHTQRYGTVFSLHVGIETPSNIGFIMSYYKGKLSRHDQPYTFSSYNIGIVISSGRNLDNDD